MKAISRRTTIAAGLGIGVLAGAGFGLTRLFAVLGHRYPSTPYDDLLARLDNRDAAAKVGRVLLPQLQPKGVDALARELRTQLGHSPLSMTVSRDCTQGAVVETNGWVLPTTLAHLFALAALVADRQG